MAPTREELLAYLRQVQTDDPFLTKEEMAALALAHFAGEAGEAKPEPEKNKEQEETVPKIAVVSNQLIDEQQLLLLIENSPLSELAAADPPQPQQPNQRESKWPVVNRRLLYLIVLLGSLFALVITVAYLYGLRTAPPRQPPAAIIDVSNAIPYETGDVGRFGKRFAGNTAYYDDKYRNKVLEMVGLVESVERSADGYFDATLLLADQKNTVFRARFRFLPEQEEAIALARGTIAVLKGNYSGYKSGIIQMFPAAVVYNSAQEQ